MFCDVMMTGSVPDCIGLDIFVLVGAGGAEKSKPVDFLNAYSVRPALKLSSPAAACALGRCGHPFSSPLTPLRGMTMDAAVQQGINNAPLLSRRVHYLQTDPPSRMMAFVQWFQHLV